jgi:NitT/TauT family transport system substrate-binding protein
MRLFIALLGLLLTVGVARAETNEVRIAQQTSAAFLQFNVMKHMNLIEKHAAALGVPDVKVSFAVFNGSDAQNQALLSGAVDIAAGGPPGLMVLWAKTFGTPQEVRGVSNIVYLPWKLNTRNPNIRSIRDFTDDDRIAMPGVKMSSQAVVLQMAAAKIWGDAEYDRFDKLGVAMSPADATAGLLSGGGAFNSAFTVPPFQDMQLKDPAIHTVLDSRDVIGNAAGSLAWTSKKFHDANPKVYRAVVEALKEATAFVNAHRREAVAFYAADTSAKVNVEDVVQIMSQPGITFDITPHGQLQWATFMGRVGKWKVQATSWKDLFWQEIWDLDGS